MCVIRAVVIAFSMYSQIPMPQFQWRDEDRRYILCFFPWVGVVIGGCIWIWSVLCEKIGIGLLGYTMGTAMIPVLITGGFHIDGFMDTMDALHSYQSRERKLEILKDSHIGAFSVIMLGAYGMLYLAAFSEIKDKKLLLIVCAGFCLARCLSGLSAVLFPLAKKEGLLYSCADNANKNIVRGCLLLQGVLCMGFMLWQSRYAGGMVVLAAIGAFAYYFYRCKKEFGGITGDTAGYFVLLCEGSMIVTAALVNILM